MAATPAPTQRSRNPFARWLGRARNGGTAAVTHDTTRTPTQGAQLGRRIVDDDDEPGPSTRPRTTHNIPVTTMVPRAYSRTPSPNLSPPPPRKANERAFDTTDDDQPFTNAGLLPTPDTEFNTFGRIGGTRAKPLSRAASTSPPTAFPGSGTSTSTPGAVPRRSTSMQEARRLQRRQQRRASGPNSVDATPTVTPRSNSPSDLSHGDGSGVHPGIARAPSVPFTFGISRGRETQDRLRGGSGRASSVDSGGMAVALSLAATTLDTGHHTEAAAARLTDSPSSFVVTPEPVMSSNTGRFSFNLAGFASGSSDVSGGDAGRGSSDGIRATGVNRAPLASVPSFAFPDSTPDSPHPASAPAAAIAVRSLTTTTTTTSPPEAADLDQGQSGGGGLAPRPPSPAPSAASRGSRFREMLEDDPDRVTVVPSTPPDDQPKPLPAASSSDHRSFFERPSFFGSSERTADGLKLMGRRAIRPVAGPGRARSRVISVGRDHDFELEVTPPTPSASTMGLGVPPAPEDAAATSSKKEGKRKASDPDGVDSEMGALPSQPPVSVFLPASPQICRSSSCRAIVRACPSSCNQICIFRVRAPCVFHIVPTLSQSRHQSHCYRPCICPPFKSSLLTCGFVAVGRRVHTVSAASSAGAPSAFRNSKRIRLSTPADIDGHQRGSWGRRHEHSPVSHASHGGPSSQGHDRPPRPSSRASTAHSARTGRSTIPVHAIVSPRPASIAGSNRTFHMRDPYARHPPPVGWRPSNTTLDTPHLHSQHQPQASTPGSSKLAPESTTAPSNAPLKRKAPWTAWAFYLGFVLFPLWWIAALSPVRAWPVREKPDWVGWLAARDERAWRRRCRWMSGVALVMYIPIIALAAVYGPKATVTEER